MASGSSNPWGQGGGRRRDNQLEKVGASSCNNWPQLFLESLAYKVAIEAARSLGRLAAAPAISNVFQVCSIWHDISQSEHLWQNLTTHIWRRGNHLVNQNQTWRGEYMYRHRTASNFRTGRAAHTNLHFQIEEEDEDESLLTCHGLALSDLHLACGLFYGSVRVFDLTSTLHVCTLRPQPKDYRLGRFSPSVSGIIIYNTNSKLVFASLDGDIHVASVCGNGPPPRRVHLGNIVNDGSMVDFNGCSSNRWWVGLYAGVPGRSFHAWDAQTEQLLFVGGSLTDPESLMGWHLLNNLSTSTSIGRVRSMIVTNDSSPSSASAAVVACTGMRLTRLDIRNDHQDNNSIVVVTNDEDATQTTTEMGFIVDSFDVGSSSTSSNFNDAVFLVVENSGLARIRRVDDFQEVRRFRVRKGRVWGCINSECAFIWTAAGGGSGAVRAWDVQRGYLLYGFTQRIQQQVTAFVANDTHMAITSNHIDTKDNTTSMIHLWDFSAI